jgi:hypothetical protein|tara:strand:+ start:127 stop:321 length:195 start_codon:yes stop_codon:yes gene_type:complete
MKLTESRVKQIIKEEMDRIHEEESVPQQTAMSANEIISKIADEAERLVVQNYIKMLLDKAGIKQ